MLLKQYVIQNKIDNIDSLIKNSISDKFLTEDLTDLVFDTSENRFFGDSVIINYKVFQQEFIKFRNSRKISIKDSIIIGDLRITDDGTPVEIFLDNCIIVKELLYYGCKVSEIKISGCNISSICFYNSEIQNCFISDSRIGTLSIEESRLMQLRFFCSSINNIEKYQSKINEFLSNGDTINITGIIKGKNLKNIDLLDFVNTSSEVMFKSLRDPIETRIETIKFLKETDLLSQKRYLQHLADLELTCLSESSPFSRRLVRCLSGFKKPSVFLVLGIVIVLTSSLVYYLSGRMFFGEKFCSSFWEALYLSGVTFSTIGYGDIHPIGFTKTIAVIEGLLGVFTCSGFLVALVNKYTNSR